MSNTNGNGDDLDGSYNYLMNAFAVLKQTTTRVINEGQSSMIIEVINEDIAMSQNNMGTQAYAGTYHQSNAANQQRMINYDGQQQNQVAQNQFNQPNFPQQMGVYQQSRMTHQGVRNSGMIQQPVQYSQRIPERLQEVRRSRIIEQHPGIVEQLAQAPRQYSQNTVSSLYQQPPPSILQTPATNLPTSYNANTIQSNINQFKVPSSASVATTGKKTQQNYQVHSMNQTTNISQNFGTMYNMPTIRQNNFIMNNNPYLESLNDRRCATPYPSTTIKYYSNSISSPGKKQKNVKSNPDQSTTNEPRAERKNLQYNLDVNSTQATFATPAPVTNRKRKISKISSDTISVQNFQNVFVSNDVSGAIQEKTGDVTQMLRGTPTIPSRVGTPFPTALRQSTRIPNPNQSAQYSNTIPNNIAQPVRVDTPHPTSNNFEAWKAQPSVPSSYKQSFGYNSVQYQNSNSVFKNTDSNLSNNCDYWNSNSQQFGAINNNLASNSNTGNISALENSINDLNSVSSTSSNAQLANNMVVSQTNEHLSSNSNASSNKTVQLDSFQSTFLKPASAISYQNQYNNFAILQSSNRQSAYNTISTNVDTSNYYMKNNSNNSNDNDIQIIETQNTAVDQQSFHNVNNYQPTNNFQNFQTSENSLQNNYNSQQNSNSQFVPATYYNMNNTQTIPYNNSSTVSTGNSSTYFTNIQAAYNTVPVTNNSNNMMAMQANSSYNMSTNLNPVMNANFQPTASQQKTNKDGKITSDVMYVYKNYNNQQLYTNNNQYN